MSWFSSFRIACLFHTTDSGQETMIPTFGAPSVASQRLCRRPLVVLARQHGARDCTVLSQLAALVSRLTVLTILYCTSNINTTRSSCVPAPADDIRMKASLTRTINYCMSSSRFSYTNCIKLKLLSIECQCCFAPSTIYYVIVILRLR